MSDTTTKINNQFDFTSFVLNPRYRFVMYGKTYNDIPERRFMKNYDFLSNALRVITSIEDIDNKLEEVNSLIVHSIVTEKRHIPGMHSFKLIVSSEFENATRIENLLDEIESNLDCADDDYAFAHCYLYEVYWRLLMIFVLLDKDQIKIRNAELRRMLTQLNIGVQIVNDEMSRRISAV